MPNQDDPLADLLSRLQRIADMDLRTGGLPANIIDTATDAIRQLQCLDDMAEVGFGMTVRNGEERDEWKSRAAHAEAELKNYKSVFAFYARPDRAGDALRAIVNLLPQRPEWTVHDLRLEVAALGVVASQKEIYNALGYLNRKGKVSRSGYGRYSITNR